jgi:hypothetical protein
MPCREGLEASGALECIPYAFLNRTRREWTGQVRALKCSGCAVTCAPSCVSRQTYPSVQRTQTVPPFPSLQLRLHFGAALTASVVNNTPLVQVGPPTSPSHNCPSGRRCPLLPLALVAALRDLSAGAHPHC